MAPRAPRVKTRAPPISDTEGSGKATRPVCRYKDIQLFYRKDIYGTPCISRIDYFYQSNILLRRILER